MPSVRPSLRISLPKDRRTKERNTGLAEGGPVDEKGSSTAKPGRHDNDRPNMFSGHKVPDLIRRVERDGFDNLYRNNFPGRQARRASHHSAIPSITRLGVSPS